MQVLRIVFSLFSLGVRAAVLRAAFLTFFDQTIAIANRKSQP